MAEAGTTPASTSTVRPNFLFIGPDKSGSSWLYEVLRKHPQCFVPASKDIYFFDRYYDRGLDWYLGFFAEAGPEHRAIGELSHDYLFSTAAADRIAADLPGVRLLTCLRQPADRSFSHYLFLVRNGITTLPFEAALDEDPTIIGNSLYGQHLGAYFDRFPPERMVTLFFDDLEADAAAFAARVFAALDLDPFDGYDFAEKVLPASKPRSALLSQAVHLGAVTARNLGLASLVGAVKRSALRNWLYRPYTADEKPQLAPDTRKLLMDRFEPDIQKLEALLGTDLAHWRD